MGAVKPIARWAALAGVVGPVGFFTAWAATGAFASHYSPVEDAISRLAAVDASTRPAMTIGFVAFGVGVSGYALALRGALAGFAWMTAFVSALSTLGVAATPLDHSHTVDTLHATFAGIGYVTLATAPLLAARPLARAGRTSWAGASVAIGVAAGVCLALTTLGPAHGLFQRLGLTIADAWIVATALVIWRSGQLVVRRMTDSL